MEEYDDDNDADTDYCPREYDSDPTSAQCTINRFARTSHDIRKCRRLLQDQMSYNRTKYPMLNACKCKKLNSSENLSEEERLKIHDDYWKMDTYLQRIWLSKHVTEKKTSRLVVENSRRKYTGNFILNSLDQNELIPVCQQFLLHTWNITLIQYCSICSMPLKTATTENEMHQI